MKRGVPQKDLDLCFSHKIVSNYLTNRVNRLTLMLVWKRNFILAYSIKTCMFAGRILSHRVSLCKLEKGTLHWGKRQSRELHFARYSTVILSVG